MKESNQYSIPHGKWITNNQSQNKWIRIVGKSLDMDVNWRATLAKCRKTCGNLETGLQRKRWKNVLRWKRTGKRVLQNIQSWLLPINTSVNVLMNYMSLDTIKLPLGQQSNKIKGCNQAQSTERQPSFQRCVSSSWHEHIYENIGAGEYV